MTADITPDLLIQAYASGIFPMADSSEDKEVFWVDPTRRGVIPLKSFHISRSLAKAVRRADYDVKINSDFLLTVENCANRPETWINDTILDLYTQLHTLGFAHSVEIWRAGHMIGGVYGVTLGGAFFGESMFSKATNGSKLALSYLVHRLIIGRFTVFDTQFLTPHLQSLGAIEISRTDYQKQLAQSLDIDGHFLAPTTPTPNDLIAHQNSFRP